MTKFLILIASFILYFSSQQSHAAGGSGFGINVGVGVPYLSQAGLNYRFNDKFSMSAGYNNLSLTAGTASVSLTMPEILVHYHPFAGSFFIALGAGQETLSVKATDTLTSLEATADVTASTMIAKVGWMWGLADGGFWFGMDAEYISPSGGKATVTAPGLTSTDQAYIDVQDSAAKFGEVAYTNITFARLGWVF